METEMELEFKKKNVGQLAAKQRLFRVVIEDHGDANSRVLSSILLLLEHKSTMFVTCKLTCTYTSH